MILDTNNKTMPFELEIDKQSACEKVRETYKASYMQHNTKSTPAQPLTFESSRDYFRRHLKRTYGGFVDDDNPLEEYLNSALENVNVLAYWKAKSTDPRWSSLACMARDYLVVQATSVPSEQIFSIAKFTIGSERNRLDPEKARATLCLKTWFMAGLIKEYEKEIDRLNLEQEN